jgi:hypothetical protein
MLGDSKSREGPKIQKAFSTVNTGVVEVLLAKISEVIFKQISNYCLFFENTPLLGLSDYSQLSNQPNTNDKVPRTLDINSVKNLENKGEAKKFTELEFKKVVDEFTTNQKKKITHTFSHSSALRLLRLLEIVSEMSSKIPEIHEFILKIFKKSNLSALIKALMLGNFRNSLLCSKILKNLISIGLESQAFKEALEAADFEGNHRLSPHMQTKNSIVDFFLSKVLEIKSFKWNGSSVKSRFSNNFADELISILKTMYSSNKFDSNATSDQPSLKESLEGMVSAYFSTGKDYSPFEKEVILQLCGADIMGMEFGAEGTDSKGNQVEILGFIDKKEYSQFKTTADPLRMEWDYKHQKVVLKCTKDDQKPKIEVEETSELSFTTKENFTSSVKLDTN